MPTPRKRDKTASPPLALTSIADLKPDDKNPNKGSERGDAMIEQSLRKYGFGRSIIVDKNGKIIAGNKTHENLLQVGLIDDPIFVDTDGKRPIIHRRTDLDLDKDPLARELSIMDNRASQVSLNWDRDVLSELDGDGIKLTQFWTEEEIDELFSEEGADSMLPPSDGSMLALADVTVAEPKHAVKRGDIFKLSGEQVHVMICCEVMRQWPIWKPFLRTEKHLFVPYPDPYSPLTLRAEHNPMVLVQPDTYIAGHLLDRWAEIKGDSTIKQMVKE